MSKPAKKYEVIKKSSNEKGVLFALAISPDNTFSVHMLKENYNGRVKGGIVKTWAYIKKGLSESDAIKLFNKRVNYRKKTKEICINCDKARVLNGNDYCTKCINNFEADNV